MTDFLLLQLSQSAIANKISGRILTYLNGLEEALSVNRSTNYMYIVLCRPMSVNGSGINE